MGTKPYHFDRLHLIKLYVYIIILLNIIRQFNFILHFFCNFTMNSVW